MSNPVSATIEALGGAKAVGVLVNVSAEAVYNAIRRESIPYRWRAQLIDEARRLGLDPQNLAFDCRSMADPPGAAA
jgi:hypothetical protein